MRANASMDSLIPRLRLLTEEHLAQLEPAEPPTALCYTATNGPVPGMTMIGR